MLWMESMSGRLNSSVSLYFALRARPEERQDDGSWVKCVPLSWVNEGTEDRGAIPHIPHIFSKQSCTAAQRMPDKESCWIPASEGIEFLVLLCKGTRECSMDVHEGKQQQRMVSITSCIPSVSSILWIYRERAIFSCLLSQVVHTDVTSACEISLRHNN